MKSSARSPAERVFGIGMHATGTMSLWAYLNSLGFRSVHWPEWYEDDLAKHIREDNAAILDVLAPLFRQYQAFCDVPFPGLYRELDLRFPQAHFILTTRSAESWWQSVARLWKLDQGRTHRLTPGETIQYRPYEPFGKAEIALEDAEIQKRKFERHNLEVADYFAGRDVKLIVVAADDPEKNRRISEFLGKPIKPYFHLNRRCKTS